GPDHARPGRPPGRDDRELGRVGVARAATGSRVGGSEERHVSRAPGRATLRVERARRGPGSLLAPVRGGPPEPLRRRRLQRDQAPHSRARRRARQYRVREAGGGAGRGSHGILRLGHGRHRLGPPASPLLPRWLRRPRRRRRMIGTELLDDPRADPVLVERELRDIARLNALFGGTRAVLEALEPFFQRSRNVRRATCHGQWTLLDVGTGSGDIALAARATARRRGIDLKAIGVELNPTAARIAAAAGVPTIVADGSALPV